VILAGGLASDFTLDAYIFPQALALSRPIATAAKPYCHSPRDHSIVEAWRSFTWVGRIRLFKFVAKATRPVKLPCTSRDICLPKKLGKQLNARQVPSDFVHMVKAVGLGKSACRRLDRARRQLPVAYPAFSWVVTRQMKSPATSRVRNSRNFNDTLHRTRAGSIHVADKDLWAFRSCGQELFCNVFASASSSILAWLELILLVRSKIPNITA
jgi:hypothetical protein